MIVDHASNEVWYDAARRMDRFVAADLLREVRSERFGSVEQAIAARARAPLRRWLLLQERPLPNGDRSPRYRPLARLRYEPETNGIAEKALQTPKEQVLWIGRFDTLDDLRTAARTFGRTYNQQWLIERHSYRTPTETREHLLREGVDRKQRHEPSRPAPRDCRDLVEGRHVSQG